MSTSTMPTLRDDFRSLVWALCAQRDVPLLVTDMIADHLVRRDLFKINTLSRSLNELANATIYRDIVVNLDGNEQSITTASLLFRTLLTSRTAAQAVRTLSLTGDPLQDWRHKVTNFGRSDGKERLLEGLTPPAMHADLTDFTEAEIKLYDKVAASSSASTRPPTNELSVWALYLHAFRFAPHIQDLRVNSDYFRFPDFRSTLQDMSLDPSMQKLRSCSLCLDLLRQRQRHPIAVQHWNSALLMPFALPGIESIEVVASLQPEAVRQLLPSPDGSLITRLTLHHYQCGESDLGSLLAATPSLRYLKYHAMTDWGWLGYSNSKEAPFPDHPVGLETLYAALRHVGGSLQELHISQDFHEDSVHWHMNSITNSLKEVPLFRQKEELSNLKRLHTLTIPYAVLLGWSCTTCVLDWDKTLPSSLRRIVWSDDFQEEQTCFGDPWDDHNLMPAISGLVGWLSAPRGDRAAEFGLHLKFNAQEFNEPVRQQIARMCEERGVLCSIEKKHADRPRHQTWRRSVPLSPENLAEERVRHTAVPVIARGRGRGRRRGR
jgi:hypothetical protein